MPQRRRRWWCAAASFSSSSSSTSRHAIEELQHPLGFVLGIQQFLAIATATLSEPSLATHRNFIGVVVRQATCFCRHRSSGITGPPDLHVAPLDAWRFTLFTHGKNGSSGCGCGYGVSQPIAMGGLQRSHRSGSGQSLLPNYYCSCFDAGFGLDEASGGTTTTILAVVVIFVIIESASRHNPCICIVAIGTNIITNN